ncbi:hypothetical protein ACRAWF_43570 [Streptomyces sp. L7]
MATTSTTSTLPTHTGPTATDPTEADTETETAPALPPVPEITLTTPEGDTTTPTEVVAGGGPRASYLGGYGQRHDGQMGLVQMEPFAPDLVDGLHHQVLGALGRRDPGPGDPVLAQLRDVLSEQQLTQHMPYLRSLGGHRITVTVDGVSRQVDVRLTLGDRRPSVRQGSLDTSDPDKHVERRGYGTREIVSSQPSGTFSTLPVPWTGTFPIAKEGPVRGVEVALAATITHNQAGGSTTVTQVVQTTSAQRSNEPSRAYDFTDNWQVRVDAPAPDPNAGNTTDATGTAVVVAAPDPARDWGQAEQHGSVTVWFPQHLVDAEADPGQALPTPADITKLPDLRRGLGAQPAAAVRGCRSTSGPTGRHVVGPTHGIPRRVDTAGHAADAGRGRAVLAGAHRRARTHRRHDAAGRGRQAEHPGWPRASTRRSTLRVMSSTRSRTTRTRRSPAG